MATLFMGACQVAPPERMVRIGLPKEPRTLNVWLASDINSRRVLSQIYHPLFTLAPDSKTSVPWLAAAEPAYNPDALTYTVRLRPAHWSDGRPLTAADVIFTANVIKEFGLPRFASHWRNVQRVTAPDPQTAVFHLKKPFATFLSRTLAAPIVPEHQWAPWVAMARTQAKPLASLLNVTVDHPIGSGPFRVVQWRRGAYLHLERNPHFFGTGLTIHDRQLGPHVDSLLFKLYGNTDVAMLALRKGDIDFYWWHTPPGHMAGLRSSAAIRRFSNQKSGLYYLGFNLRRPPFNDPALRRAVAHMVDKKFIVDRILQGYGEAMASIVPPGNHLWHAPGLPTYSPGATRDQRIRTAHRILVEAGYTWRVPPIDPAGNIAKGQEIRLPNGRPMDRVVLLTPPADYDPHRAICGLMIQEWLRDMGIPLFARPMDFGALLQQVKVRRDFDAFVLGYGRLSLDPDYLRSFFHSRQDKPRGWNMSGYRNSEYDRLAIDSRNEMDSTRRRQMIIQMQGMVARDIPYLPLYNPMLNEAIRIDRFRGWVSMLEGIGNPWSFCTIRPVAQR